MLWPADLKIVYPICIYTVLTCKQLSMGIASMYLYTPSVSNYLLFWLFEIHFLMHMHLVWIHN